MAQKKLNESSINNNSYLSEPRWIVREDGSKERHMIGYLQPKKEKGISQEDRKLLLKDLCARLPYGIKGLHRDKVEEVRTIDAQSSFQNYSYGAWFPIDTFKPYLRPISSMTEEEMDKLFDILKIDKDGKDEDWIKINDVLGIKFFFPTGKWVEHVALAYDYLYSIHIDFRGLIPIGLALEAPEGMYKTE